MIDYVDVGITLVSFRHFCEKFRLIVEKTNRFEFDLSVISSRKVFDRLHHLINIETMPSITLVNNEQTSNQIYSGITSRLTGNEIPWR